MKLSQILCASLVALAAAAFVAGGASATATIKSTKSNGSLKIGTAAGTTEADCTKAGGKVTEGRDGKRCVMPEGAGPAASANIHFHGTHTSPASAVNVQDNAIADTGKCAKNKGSAGGGAGDRAQQGRVQLDADWNESHCDKGKDKRKPSAGLVGPSDSGLVGPSDTPAKAPAATPK